MTIEHFLGRILFDVVLLLVIYGSLYGLAWLAERPTKAKR